MRHGLVGAKDLAFEVVKIGGADLGIEEAADAVGEILGGEFALLTFERWVRGEVNPLLDVKRIRGAMVRHFRHRFGDIGHQFYRPHQIVVGQQRIEDRLQNESGVAGCFQRRVKACFSLLEGKANHLVGIGRMGHGRENKDYRCD